MDKKTIEQIKFALMDKRKREFEKARRERKEQERLRAMAQQVSAADS